MGKLSIVLAAAALLLGIAQASAAAETLESGRLSVRVASAMDANRDGVITREEFMAVSRDEALWIRLDRNGDGILDSDELRRAVRFPRHTRY